MRIVGGRLRGRAIASAEHSGLRPTSDRVRESVFNILAHGIDGFELDGARVIDLFAGTGALGLEAVSRGASFCVFVEEAPDQRGLIRSNVETLGLTGVTRVFRRDATELGAAGTMAPLTLAFLDPPYGQGLAEKALCSLREGGWLCPNAVIIVEERANVAIAWPVGFKAFDHRSYGDTQINLARFIAGA